MPDRPRTRPLGVLRRLAFLVAVAVVAVGGSTVGTALAGFAWPDVPPGSYFEDHINWLTFQQNIAQGYGDGTFRQKDPISRGQMAFWLGNYNGRFTVVEGTAAVAPGGQDSLSAVALCPAGLRPLGGGGKTLSTDLIITDTFPGLASNTWQTRWESDNDAAIPQGTVATAWALCAPVPVPANP